MRNLSNGRKMLKSWKNNTKEEKHERNEINF